MLMLCRVLDRAYNEGMVSQSFLCMHPPQTPIKFGDFKVSTGNAGRVVKQNGYMRRPIIVIEYEAVSQAELSNWVLFQAFLINDNMTLKTYMNTLDGELTYEDKPFGNEANYDDILDTVYFAEITGIHLGYEELYKRFVKANDHQLDMIKNYLIEITPGTSYNHGELVNYSYWKLVIYFSIIEGIFGQQEFCAEQHECKTCGKKAQHYPIDSKAWMELKIMEVVGDDKKTKHYLDLIWAVRQKVRHTTAHASAHPTAKHILPEIGETVYDTEKAVKEFKSDNEALEALVFKMKDVTRILLLNDVLKTGVFPDIKPFMVRRIG